jgi:hypothetical protein
MKNNHRFLLSCYSIALLSASITAIIPAQAQPNPLIEQSAAPVNPSSPAAGQQKSENASSLWSLGTLLLLPLHIVEIWGIIQLFLSLKKSQRSQSESSKALKDENKKLAEEVQELSKKLQKHDAKSQQIEKDRIKTSSTANKPISLFPESAPTPSFFDPPSNDPITPIATVASDYPFLDSYNRNPDSFAQQYALTVVSEDATNINDRRSGDSTDIILSESRNGNYWLIKENNITYLIPRPKVKIQEHNIRTVRGLFECSTFDPDYQSFTVVQPAIVTVVVSSVQSLNDGIKWKIEQKGELNFI